MNYKVPEKYMKDLEAFLSGSGIPGVSIDVVDHDTLIGVLGNNAKELNFGASDYAMDGTGEVYLNEDMDLPGYFGVGAHEIAHKYTEYGNEDATDELAIMGLLNISMDSTKPMDLRMKAKYGIEALREIDQMEKNLAQKAVKYLHEEGMN